MKFWIIGIVGLTLAACAQTPQTPEAREAGERNAITTSTGGGFGGSQTTTIFMDDRVRVVTFVPGESQGVSRDVVVPGAHGRALDAVRRLLPAAVAGKDTGRCPDYGVDMVMVDPPVAAGNMVSVSCPDEDVSALIRAVNGATSAAEPL